MGGGGCDLHGDAGPTCKLEGFVYGSLANLDLVCPPPRPVPQQRPNSFTCSTEEQPKSRRDEKAAAKTTRKRESTAEGGRTGRQLAAILRGCV